MANTLLRQSPNLEGKTKEFKEKQVNCQKGLRTLLNMWSGPDFFFCDAAVFVPPLDLSEAFCLESFEFF